MSVDLELNLRLFEGEIDFDSLYKLLLMSKIKLSLVGFGFRGKLNI